MDTLEETPKVGSSGRKKKLWTTRTLVIVIILVLTIGAAAAFSILFTHTFPPIPATGVAVLTTNCATLTANPTSVIPGSSGGVKFTCGTGNALTAVATGSATPIFTLPTGYASLGLIFHTDTCPPTTDGIVALTSGTPTSFGTGATPDYCAEFTNAPAGGLATFTVEWTQ